MPLRVVRSQSAKLDLIEIWDFIAPDNKAAARKLLGRIGDQARNLADAPEMGRTRPELGEDVRSFPMRGYTIFYDVKGKDLRILRVLHDARELKTSMMEFRD